MTGLALPASVLPWPLRRAKIWLPVLMLLALLGGLLGAFRLGLSLGEPFPGFVLLWRKEYKLFTVSWVTPPNWSGPTAGMMINDRILCINGYWPYVPSANTPVYGLDPRYTKVSCKNGYKDYTTIFREAFQSTERRVDFLVDRAGVIQTIPKVPLERFNLALLLETFVPDFLLGIALLGLGFVVYRANPEFEINLIFCLVMLISSNFAFNSTLAGHISNRQFETGRITLVQIVPWLALTGPLIFHLMDLLSSPGPLSAAAHRIRRPFYLLGGVFSVVGGVVYLFNNILFLQPLSWVYVLWVASSAAFSMLWSLISLGLAYRQAVQRQVRMQTGLVLIALALGVLICIPFAGLFLANQLSFPYMQGLPYAGLVVLGLIAYAILRYQLFTARTQILNFLLILVVSVVAALIIYLLVGREIGFVPLLGSALLAGSVFAGRFKPLNFLDRLLHRQESDYQVVARFGKRIQQPQSMQHLANAAILALKDELEAEQINLWLLDPDQPALEHYSGDEPVETLPLAASLAPRVVQTDGPVYAFSQAGQDFAGSLPKGSRLSPNGLWAPLSEHDQALGLLYLGPPWTGEVYSEDDLHLVRLLTGQLGLAITNTRQVERLQTMQRLILQAGENERYKIARELHDTILQFMLVLTFEIDSIKENPARLSERVEGWQERISDEASHLRDLLGYLRTPETLEQRGLLTSLELLFTVMRGQTTTRLEWELDPKVELVLSTEAKVALYRVMREAVQNSLKHACAQKVTVHLVKEDERVIFTIQDDGQGFDIPAALHSTTKGYNSLQDMRIYVESTGGRLEIQSTPGEGTTLQGWVYTQPIISL